MEIIAQFSGSFMWMAVAFGFLMAWGVGANDVANAMGTSVGSRALTLRQAIIIAIIFEFAGAVLAGGEVTSTVRSGIIDPLVLAATPELLIYGMMSSLLAAGIWLVIASIMGWPVSTTHSIIGAIVGFSAVGIGVEFVAWGKVASIAASWITSPLLAGSISFALFVSVQRLILETEDPFAAAQKYVPYYMFLVGFLISMVTLLKGLTHLGLNLSFAQSGLLSCLIGLAVALLGKAIIVRIKRDESAERRFRFHSVEKIFAVLMIFTACAMAFAHGSNDVANAIGPVAAIMAVLQTGGEIGKEAAVPTWVLLLGGLGIVTGLATYGYKVMGTIGKKITELTPSRGFAAELGAAGTVVLASGIGLPISTTHTLVGAVLGVGLARGISALNLRVIGNIFLSWLITLPAGAGLSILFFFAFKGFFG